MPDKTYKIVDVVGVSDESIHQAQALRLAAKYPEAIKYLSQVMLVASDDPRVVSEYGKTLAATTGREAGRILFFDVATGKANRAIDSPPLDPGTLAFTPDGGRLVSGMADGSILVWDVKPPR